MEDGGQTQFCGDGERIIGEDFNLSLLVSARTHWNPMRRKANGVFKKWRTGEGQAMTLD